MRRILIAFALLLAACGVEPGTTSVEQDAQAYCNAPIKVACYPWTPGGDNAYCNATCLAFNGVSGRCPEATQYELDWCAFHPNDSAFPCVGGWPRRVHYCVTGLNS